MNNFHKLTGGLIALLAVFATWVGPASADDGSDTQDVTIDANDIALLDVKDTNTTSNSASDDSDGLTLTFDDGANGNFQTAGTETTTETGYSLLAWSINFNAKITVCTSGSFADFAKSQDSKSYLKVKALDNNLADGSSAGWVTLWENTGGTSASGINCNNSEDFITGLTPSFDPGDNSNAPEIEYEAKYDINDGNFSNTIGNDRTIVSQ